MQLRQQWPTSGEMPWSKASELCQVTSKRAAYANMGCADSRLGSGLASQMRELTVINRQALGRPVADLPAQVQLGPRDKVGVWSRPEACLNVLGGAWDHLPIL